MEVNYNGEWGTVCDGGWDDTDAGVVCRQLGFGSSGTAIGSAGFGQGSGSIFLDGVSCIGSEIIVARCGHLGINVTKPCSHAEDAGVRCGSQGNNYIINCCLDILPGRNLGGLQVPIQLQSVFFLKFKLSYPGSPKHTISLLCTSSIAKFVKADINIFKAEFL